VERVVGGRVAVVGFPLGHLDGWLEDVVAVVAEPDDVGCRVAGVDVAHGDDAGGGTKKPLVEGGQVVGAEWRSRSHSARSTTAQ
jgi:hypothetical protein